MCKHPVSIECLLGMLLISLWFSSPVDCVCKHVYIKLLATTKAFVSHPGNVKLSKRCWFPKLHVHQSCRSYRNQQLLLQLCEEWREGCMDKMKRVLQQTLPPHFCLFLTAYGISIDGVHGVGKGMFRKKSGTTTHNKFVVEVLRETEKRPPQMLFLYSWAPPHMGRGSVSARKRGMGWCISPQQILHFPL